MATPGVTQVDLPCPGLHTCYYKKFFLLRMSVKVNGKPTQVTLNSQGYPVLQYYSEDEETGIDINMSVVSKLVTHELVNYGVYHVDTYYFDNVPIFSVTFAFKAQLEKFLRSNNTQVKVAVDRLLGEEFQKRYTEIMKKTSKLSVNTDSTLHLITPCEYNKPTVVRVTLANFSTLRCTWQQSELFIFRDIEALFSGTVEEAEAEVGELLNELNVVTKWFWFGSNLKVPESTLLRIKADNKDRCQECLREVIIEWGRIETRTWSKVVLALVKTGYKEDAQKLSILYCVNLPSKNTEAHCAAQNALDLESSLVEKNEQLEADQRELIKIKQSCERDTDKLDEQARNYEKLSAEVKELSEQLRDKEEEVDTLNTTSNLRYKEIKKLKGTLEKLKREKEMEANDLKREISMKKHKLLECASKINELQNNLDKKTEEYERLSSKVSQLENERDKTENDLKRVRNECELKVQRQAARAQGAEHYAKEVEFQLTESKGEVMKIKEKIQSLELEEQQHMEEITELRLELDEKENEKKRLQKQQQVGGSSLVEECEDVYIQLMQVLGDTTKLKQDITDRERVNSQKKTELALLTKEVELLNSKLADMKQCTVEGQGLQRATKYQVSCFVLHVRNEFGSPCTCDQNVHAELRHCDTATMPRVKADVKLLDTPAGDYEVTYTPQCTGDHELSAFVNGHNINGSPFKIFVDNLPDTQHCTASGPGLDPVKKDKSNSVSFKIKLADSDNEQCVLSQNVPVINDIISVNIRATHSGELIPVTMVPESASVYRVSYTPAVAGEIEVSVMVNGVHIENSPWTVRVDNPPDLSRSVVVLEGNPHEFLRSIVYLQESLYNNIIYLKKERSKIISTDIYLRDSFNDPCVFEQKVSVILERRMASIPRLANDTIYTNTVYKSPSHYQISFIPDKAGEWMVEAKVNGI